MDQQKNLASNYLIVLNDKGQITFATGKICDIVGRRRSLIRGWSLTSLLERRFLDPFRTSIFPLMLGDSPVGEIFISFVDLKGQIVPMLASCHYVKRSGGARIICTFEQIFRKNSYLQDLSQISEELRRSKMERNDLLEKLASAYEALITETKELGKLNEEFIHMAFTDKLTEVPNRRGFEIRHDEEYLDFLASGAPFSLLIVDIDLFKVINDTYGHEGGDLVLRGVSNVMAKAVRKHDFVSRWGGEEFVVLLPKTGVDAAILSAERIRIAVAKANFRDMSVTVSIGIATCDGPECTCSLLMISADLALYAAKQGGRNQVQHSRNLERTFDRRHGNDPIPPKELI